MNKKLVIGIIIAVVLLGGLFIFFSKDKKEDVKEPSNELVDDNTYENNEDKEQVVEGNANSSSNSNNHSNDVTKPVESIAFPYNIANSDITILQFAPYTGAYLEDGSNVEIKDVASIMIQNNSKNYIEYALITVKQGDKVYEFKACTLGPGEMMFVQDLHKQAYSNATITNVSCDMAYIDSFDMLEDKISVKEVEQGIEVINKTDKDISTVRLFYKLYMSEEEMYVGGIAYVAKIDGLKANSSIIVEPRHYFPGNSKIRMVRIYE